MTEEDDYELPTELLARANTAGSENDTSPHMEDVFLHRRSAARIVELEREVRVLRGDSAASSATAAARRAMETEDNHYERELRRRDAMIAGRDAMIAERDNIAEEQFFLLAAVLLTTGPVEVPESTIVGLTSPRITRTEETPWPGSGGKVIVYEARDES